VSVLAIGSRHLSPLSIWLLLAVEAAGLAPTVVPGLAVAAVLVGIAPM